MKRSAWVLIWLMTLTMSGGLSWWRQYRQVNPDDMAQACQVIRQSVQPMDLIIAEPWYLQSIRDHLGDQRFITPKELIRADVLDAKRIFLLSAQVVNMPTDFSATLKTFSSLINEQTFGRVRLRQFSINEPQTALFDLYRDVHQVEVVDHLPNGQVVNCNQFEQGRWLCPKEPAWNYVGQDLLTIEGEVRPCVWLHPLPAKGRVLVRIPIPAQSAEARVVGGFGFSDSAAFRGPSLVEISLNSEQEPFWRMSIAADETWHHFETNLPPAIQELVIELTTEYNGAAHVCGELKVVEAIP